MFKLLWIRWSVIGILLLMYKVIDDNSEVAMKIINCLLRQMRNFKYIDLVITYKWFEALWHRDNIV